MIRDNRLLSLTLTQYQLLQKLNLAFCLLLDVVLLFQHQRHPHVPILVIFELVVTVLS